MKWLQMTSAGSDFVNKKPQLSLKPETTPNMHKIYRPTFLNNLRLMISRRMYCYFWYTCALTTRMKTNSLKPEVNPNRMLNLSSYATPKALRLHYKAQ
jgi:hypothetical protein